MVAVAVAAETTDGHNTFMARFLNAIGWLTGDHVPITESVAAHGAWGTKVVLRRLGALNTARGVGTRARSTLDGVTFARAALQSWN